MTFRERVLIGIIASMLVLSVFAPSCDPQSDTQSDTVISQACLNCAIETGEQNNVR